MIWATLQVIWLLGFLWYLGINLWDFHLNVKRTKGASFAIYAGLRVLVALPGIIAWPYIWTISMIEMFVYDEANKQFNRDMNEYNGYEDGDDE